MAAIRRTAISAAEGRILAVLVILLATLALTGCARTERTGDNRQALSLFQKAISFEQVPVGATEDQYFLTVVNNGSQTVTLQGAKADAPFGVLFERPVAVEPGAFVGVQVAFKPQAEGAFNGQISITADNGQTLTAPVSGKGIPYKETPPEQWAEIQLVQNSFVVSEDASQLNGAFMVSIKPGVPYALRKAVLKLEIQGAEGAGEVSLDAAQTNLLIATPVGFRVKFKRGSEPPATKLVGKAILLDATGKEVFTYFSPPLIPLQAPPQGAPPACGCLPGPPPPPVELATNTSYFPDSPIPGGDGPGATAGKVAEVKVSIKGPAVGTCCKPPEKFDFSLLLASDFALPGGGAKSNVNTAHQIIRACRGVNGLSITAATNGAAHAITSAPGSAFACPAPAGGGPALPNPGAAIGNIILQTSFQEPITCTENAQCPCVVATNRHVTVIQYGGGAGLPAGVGGAGTGGIIVIWNVSLAAGGGNCATGKPTGTIDRVLFYRVGDVYDPARHGLGWLNAVADPDNDGRNNARELVEGKDPNLAD